VYRLPTRVLALLPPTHPTPLLLGDLEPPSWGVAFGDRPVTLPQGSAPTDGRWDQVESPLGRAPGASPGWPPPVGLGPFNAYLMLPFA
jgi:hypothetical protein